MANHSVVKLLERFAADEREFLKREFLAPAVRGGEARVRVAGVVLQMRIEPRDFEGWGVFRPTSSRTARLVREARLAERRRYLQLMTSVPLILCHRTGGAWSAVAAHQGDRRFQLEGAAPVRMVENADLFDTVRAGFDGANFWCGGVDRRASAATAAWLREAMANKTEPRKLDRKGLTSQQRAAYALHYVSQIEAQRKAQQDGIEDRLREALGHAGARLLGYAEHKDGFRVTYTAGGRRHVSSVNKQDLSVQVAGICLSGEDRKFDLASLVGVLSESDAGGP